jgi:hypothetical protein
MMGKHGTIGRGGLSSIVLASRLRPAWLDPTT